jgi:hypothetical protein
MIEYILKKNTLGHGDVAAVGYHAQTVQGGRRTTRDFIRTMVMLRPGITEGEAAQWVELMGMAVTHDVNLGFDVNIEGLLTARMDIQGTFPDADSSFDAARNRLHVGMTASRVLTKGSDGSATHRVSVAASGIFIEHFHDVASNTDDSVMTPGMVGNVYGSKIKLAGDDPGVGLYCIDEAGGETQVAAGAISHNGDKEIAFVIPGLADGVYTLMVKTQYSGGASLLTLPRSFVYPVLLTVGTP